MTNYVAGTDVDIVIAGGGTAACVLAGRLQRNDPNLSILLIEQGRNNYNDPTVVNPAIYPMHIAPNSTSALFHKCTPNPHLDGREVVVPSGGILGGGSSINFMMYTRGQAVDYDSFDTEGWTHKELLPLFKRLETFHPDTDGFDMSLHGTDGPINISRSYKGAAEAEEDVMEAGKTIGLPEITDMQDFNSVDGCMRWYRYVGPDGKRQDAAHRYIHPLLQDGKHKNLHLLLETKVKRVLFDENKRAVGVEYVHNSANGPLATTSLSDRPEAATGTVKARKLVVVASGAMGTPQILERSGVGNKSLLEKLNIPLVADVPGVGESYQDHHLILYPYKSNLGLDHSLDGVLSGRLDFGKAVADSHPILSWNCIDVAAKIRPTPEEVEAFGPDFQKAWEKDFANVPSRPLMVMAALNAFFGDPSLVAPGQYVTMAAFTGYPYSRGSIHINTTDMSKADGYDFDNGFMSDKGGCDMIAQIWVYKKLRDLYRRTYAYRGELELGHPKFPKGSKAALLDLEGKESLVEQHGGRDKVPELTYGKEDDAAIETFVRQNVSTTWHSIGTCAMRPFEKGGVVDKDLNVYGVQGLKLVDLSILPENVGSNTNNSALLVGEKGAEIIGRELGLLDYRIGA